VQRRFQKILEETPSPALEPAKRAEICATAAAIARAAAYRNAGTVEFIYSDDGTFYFLEMNTRLQVEHPVTEAVTGIDLVAEQLRVAMGERLGFRQDDVRQSGHAIELRIYAEEPARNFAPATGRILRLGLPRSPGIRVDGGVREGQQVTAAFDPMLAKLIAHGAGRAEAIARARFALEHFVLLGCATNAAFLDRLLAHPAFVRGEIHTGFLDAHPELAANPPIDSDTMLALLAAAALSQPQVLDAARAVPEPHASIGAWRN
jgi:propionyl-CoA carboxylase alpha chain/3-methylcrotonyl-CoA carboxylase alpha subunit/acetyl-CoA/propionyl-CoA carboxylase biotin carboxyl carrier protein